MSCERELETVLFAPLRKNWAEWLVYSVFILVTYSMMRLICVLIDLPADYTRQDSAAILNGYVALLHHASTVYLLGGISARHAFSKWPLYVLAVWTSAIVLTFLNTLPAFENSLTTQSVQVSRKQTSIPNIRILIELDFRHGDQ
jgi:hypothetical protein